MHGTRLLTIKQTSLGWLFLFDNIVNWRIFATFVNLYIIENGKQR